MLRKGLIFICFAIALFILSLNSIRWLRSPTTFIYLTNISKIEEVLVEDLRPDGTYRFQRFNTSQPLFVVSAYWQQDYKTVRVFMMKQKNSQPRIQCRFGHTRGPASNLIPATDCAGRVYRFTEWNEFTATLRGFSICCSAPDGKPAIVFTTLYLSPDVDNSLSVSTVSLPIHRSLPDPKKTGKFPHTFAVCVAPIFNMKEYSVNFLVDFFEMHRAMGAELFLVYLSNHPTSEMKQVLDSYQSHASFGREKNMTVIVIPWYLSPFMNVNATWAHTQIIAYNDCLYRFGHFAEYFVMTDLDELLVPNPRFGYSWSNMLKGLQAVAGQYFPIACSCLRRMWFEPKTKKLNSSKFYAERITILSSKFRCTRKCIVRSGLVQLFHVHQALLPPNLYAADDTFIVLHYRRCEENCIPDPREVAAYRYIWPLREGIQSDIDRRLAHITKVNL